MKFDTPLHPCKACPVVIRGEGAIEILVFEHPLAGLQLVKGTIEPGEHSRDAAVRELREESGLSASKVLADLGIWRSGYENQVWAFHLCDAGSPLQSWTYRTSDDGGHDFRFFWYPLSQQPNEKWHWVFQGALKYIAAKLHVSQC
ncbi:NUDIX hydrolase [Comamonas composti]|uniref:NUDIX hydrolase n=1 Tax=Comamonas composti TaxID=408558 RepID=UPI000A063366|nr:NUDIX domain-containing protein [Comamonas composti]